MSVINTDDCIHRIVLRSRSARLEVAFLLHQRGITAQLADEDDEWNWYVLTFHAPADYDLDFLRPKYLPPKT